MKTQEMHKIDRATLMGSHNTHMERNPSRWDCCERPLSSAELDHVIYNVQFSFLLSL